MYLHESFSSLASLETKGFPCISRGSSSTSNGSTANLFPLLFCRVLVTHVDALTQWNSHGRLELVLTTGSHMVGRWRFARTGFYSALELDSRTAGVGCVARMGELLVVRFLHRDPLTTHSATCPFLHHSRHIPPSEFRLAAQCPTGMP